MRLGFSPADINPIPVLQKVASRIFSHDEISVSNFIVSSAAESLNASVANYDNGGLRVSAQQQFQVRTVGD